MTRVLIGVLLCTAGLLLISAREITHLHSGFLSTLFALLSRAGRSVQRQGRYLSPPYATEIVGLM